MKLFIGPILACAIAVGVGAPALAAAPTRHERMATMTFRIRVAGRIDPGTTFWLAHGPIDGRFGIVELHAVGHHIFGVSQRFPLGLKANFTYVMGYGTVRTRAGLEPGSPVVTIDAVGPLHLNGEILPTVQWQAPIG